MLAQTEKVTQLNIAEVKQFVVPSEKLAQDRSITVYLPKSYQSTNKDYATLYLLDGERHLPHAILATRLHQELNNIPEMIIVAINNKEEDGAREQDLFHNRVAFRHFITSELRSYITENYRASDSAILYGHSLAGFFALDLIATQPQHFSRVIAASPPLQGDAKRIYSQLSEHKLQKQTYLYLTIAAQHEEGEPEFSAFQRFSKLLAESTPENLIWTSQVMAEQSHISNYYLTFFNGIAKVYDTEVKK
ncbi:alpha/beta hydrolase [Planctobacterium marinum]|uniref:Periplasmic siderophore cleavage esterase IroE family protein n=1 Tax=Planctobacterium marinum TaxID=1631968 RepID=A0AA48I4M0_9ALTE|nr:periplasmic siderophore cleavage esterase IroE family protein [Planctobacterium marinum]